MQIGFIGLGNMGSRMVANLRQGGHQLVVHDCSISAMEAVCKDGAETASSPADMASAEGTSQAESGHSGFCSLAKRLWTHGVCRD